MSLLQKCEEQPCRYDLAYLRAVQAVHNGARTRVREAQLYVGSYHDTVTWPNMSHADHSWAS